jgi:uncharacterized membrane protein YkvA (DUF1232 family)
MEYTFTEEQAYDVLRKNQAESEEILHDEDKLERLFQRLEKKLKIVPIVGSTLAEIPMMASLIKSYVQKEYTDIPIGTIVAVIGALAYFVSPIDLIPDNIPGAGYIDDGVVITVCLKMVDSDLQEYKIWREQNGKVFELPDFEADIPLKKKIHRKGKKID